MAYDERLAERVRDLVPDAVEKRMFGGLAFLVDGHMAVCVSGQGGLMVRLDSADHAALVDGAHVEPMVMGGRTSRTWVRVTEAALQTDRDLATWLERGLAVARALPPKAWS